MHPQDQLLVAEALVQFAGVPRHLSSRERRAWHLAEAIIADMEIGMDEFVRQIDGEWGGPGSA